MKKVGRGVRIAVIVLAAIPTLFILWQIIGIIVNYTSATFKTDSILNGFSNSGIIDVLDHDTFVGNTSGTGNHTEARSTILVNCPERLELEYWLGGYSESSFIFPLSDKAPDEINERWGKGLKIPNDVSECYVVEVYSTVPFRDSILGH